jgi:drug/metabolite transporter (DMT)-like permease
MVVRRVVSRHRARSRASPPDEMPLKTHSLRADCLMLFAALLWGCSFVVQRLSLATIGPLLFTGVRFLLGATVIALLSHWLKRPAAGAARQHVDWPWGPGSVLGVVVAISIAAQQVGLAYTKVANAGFISSMYVVIVPLLSVLLGQTLRLGIIAGALCATVGLYFLSGEHLTLSYGDGLELFGAVAIALQLMLLGAYTQKHDPLTLALIQNLVCGVVCMLAAWVVEPVRWQDVERSTMTLLYCGVISVGVGYAIQAVAQRDALPAHAAIIFSMEGVFAALAARVFIHEQLSWHAIIGCSLVVAGCIASQAPGRRRISGSSQASSPINGR